MRIAETQATGHAGARSAMSGVGDGALAIFCWDCSSAMGGAAGVSAMSPIAPGGMFVTKVACRRRGCDGLTKPLQNQTRRYALNPMGSLEGTPYCVRTAAARDRKAEEPFR